MWDTAKPCPNTVVARQRDCTVIAVQLAEFVERSQAENDEDAPVPALDVVSEEDLKRSNLEVAHASYAADRAPNSTRRVMATWPRFCLWPIREGHLYFNPLEWRQP